MKEDCKQARMVEDRLTPLKDDKEKNTNLTSLRHAVFNYPMLNLQTINFI